MNLAQIYIVSARKQHVFQKWAIFGSYLCDNISTFILFRDC